MRPGVRRRVPPEPHVLQSGGRQKQRLHGAHLHTGQGEERVGGLPGEQQGALRKGDGDSLYVVIGEGGGWLLASAIEYIIG